MHLGVYLCTKELLDLFEDTVNNFVIRERQKLEDVFKCSEIEGLEELSNLNYELPLNLIDKMSGKFGKGHPTIMQGIKIEKKDKNKRTTMSIFIVPWKGFMIRKKLGSKNQRYRLELKQIENRILSILIIGLEDEVELLEIQIELRAQTVKDGNIYGICKEATKDSLQQNPSV